MLAVYILRTYEPENCENVMNEPKKPGSYNEKVQKSRLECFKTRSSRSQSSKYAHVRRSVRVQFLFNLIVILIVIIIVIYRLMPIPESTQS